MITREDVKRLATLRHESGIVSAYVGFRRRLMHEPSHPVTAFKGACKRFLASSSGEQWKEALEREQKRIVDHLELHRPKGRGIVFFACEPLGLFEIHTLQVSVPTSLTVDTTTSTTLLTQLLDEFPSFAIVIAQKDRARIYLSEQANDEEVGEITSTVQGLHQAGGWSQARFQRHVEVQAAEHGKKVIEELARLDLERPFRRLAVGGPEPTVSDFLKQFPNELAQKVIGTFPVDIKHEGDEEILARAREVFEEDERRSEQQLVQELLDAAGAGGAGVIGLKGTVAALLEGRVRTLLVADGASTDGSVCPNCDYFAADAFTECPLCSTPAEAAPDVVGLAMERALLSGAHVESLLGDGREALLQQGHEVGALLRY